MAIIRNLKGLAIAGIAMGAMQLGAQESPFNFEVKLHTGLMAGSLQRNHCDNKMFGLGIEGQYSLGGTKAITAELSYDVLAGRWQDTTRLNGPVYIDPVSAIPGTPAGTAPTTTWNGAPMQLTPQNSIDIHKESAQGFSLRVGYTDALPWVEGMTWKAGLSLDTYKVMAEFTGTLVPFDTNAQGNNDVDSNYYEGWAFTTPKTKVGVGAFVGVGMALMKDLRVEFNVRDVATGHYDYQPFTYTGRPATLQETTVHAPIFEIALALTF